MLVYWLPLDTLAFFERRSLLSDSGIISPLRCWEVDASIMLLLRTSGLIFIWTTLFSFTSGFSTDFINSNILHILLTYPCSRETENFTFLRVSALLFVFENILTFNCYVRIDTILSRFTANSPEYLFILSAVFSENKYSSGRGARGARNRRCRW